MKLFTTFLLIVASVLAEDQNKTFHPKNFTLNIPFIHRGSSFLGSRIVGGGDALKGQFPHQVGLMISLVGDSSFCGGTLISNRTVLTAAHCCEGATKIDVILGSVGIYDQTELHRKTLTVLKRKIKIHEKWVSDSLTNDICLLYLPEEVELSEHISIASLPNDDSKDFTDQNVIASGWGLASDNSLTISPTLKYVKLKVMRNAACNVYFFGSIRETNICTSGRGGMSTCNGDSGGPIILENTSGNNPTVVGITSFGISLGCELGWPAVFTRVSKYLNWIQGNMK